MIDPESETPVQVVHRHVEAMGRRDLDAFLAECAGIVRLLSPEGMTQLDGKSAFRDTYANIFEANPDLKVELIDRMSVGNWVFDEHLASGFADGRQVHAVRVYKVEHGRIQSIQVYT
jgi:hypothetical protein